MTHQKTHTGIRFPCTICQTTFKYKSHLNRHRKNLHESVIRFAPPVAPQIQIAPQIFVPDVPAGGSNMLTKDDICMFTMDAYEMQDADTDDEISINSGDLSRLIRAFFTLTADAVFAEEVRLPSAVRVKKARMSLNKSPEFIEISSSGSRVMDGFYISVNDSDEIFDEDDKDTTKIMF
ncbi:zinc finger protein 668-like, partial [Aphis craccivora]